MNKTLLSKLLICGVFTSVTCEEQLPDVGLNIVSKHEHEYNIDFNFAFGVRQFQLVTKYGYPIEDHKNIQTQDGYLLDIHRIPHGKDNVLETNKSVVFLQHGLISSSVDWINMGPEKSLGYLLADLGYDVWMGNARGTTWSRKHVTYDPNKDAKEFWAFRYE